MVSHVSVDVDLDWGQPGNQFEPANGRGPKSGCNPSSSMRLGRLQLSCNPSNPFPPWLPPEVCSITHERNDMRHIQLTLLCRRKASERVTKHSKSPHCAHSFCGIKLHMRFKGQLRVQIEPQVLHGTFGHDVMHCSTNANHQVRPPWTIRSPRFPLLVEVHKLHFISLHPQANLFKVNIEGFEHDLQVDSVELLLRNIPRQR